ncbi:myeloid cell nuclear differentiation antigen-like [Poeciliopsis prolifica]|uniref:myeloid cell nuclear differentiation antigen-like n=1 Tax=Poeciliopsis prolifica TaxID=188132 RepID=UPI0024138007|nr:myeloid cell nuclear differentiation antigen-like [Poeciliopsis prolifica]
MFDMSESSKWKQTLTNIVKELREQQYKHMLECLKKIPKSVKEAVHLEEMPQTIIECYGEEDSIAEINRIMDEIPRRDFAIQNLLRPFVEKQGKKRKPGPESEEKQESPSELKKKKKTDNDDDDKAGFESDSDSSDDETQADDPGSSQSDKKVPPWRQSIRLLKESKDTNGKPIGGKVVQKCALRTYETKENQKKKFFHMAVADETDSIKVMVYGEELFNKVEEGRLYLFTDVNVHVVHGETFMKVTKHSKISKTNDIEAPKTMELQSPFFSIKKVQSFKEETAVSVKGTIIAIGPQEDGANRKTQEFQLEDETGSIWIKLWRKDIEQLTGKSVGDTVSVTNLLTNQYCETASLNSTDFIKITQTKAAAVQRVTMQIVGIIEAGKEQTELDVLINNKSRSFFIKSRLLAKVFDVKLDDDFEDRLVKKIPFLAKGKIKRNKIQILKAAKAMNT